MSAIAGQRRITTLRKTRCGREVWGENYLYFGSDNGADPGVQLYGQIWSCLLNGIDPEGYLRYALSMIANWPVNRVGELLPWRVILPGE